MKPTLHSFGRDWPLDELSLIEAQVTITLPDGSPEEIKADLERRLSGMDAQIKVTGVQVIQVREPERIEYQRLQNEVYQAYLQGRSPRL